MSRMSDFATGSMSDMEGAINTAPAPVYRPEQLRAEHYADLYSQIARMDNPVPYDMTLQGDQVVLTVRNPVSPMSVVMDQSAVSVPSRYFIDNQRVPEAHAAKHFHVLQYLGAKGNLGASTMTDLNFHAARAAMTLRNRIQSRAAGGGQSTGAYGHGGPAAPYGGYGNGQGRGMGR
jgi:hypothetical protein